MPRPDGPWDRVVHPSEAHVGHARQEARSPVAVFGVGEVRAGGRVIATGVPVHVMTMEDGAVELDVGDPAAPVPALPDGHLRAVWSSSVGTSPEGHERARNALGRGVLLVLLGLAVAATRSECVAGRRR